MYSPASAFRSPSPTFSQSSLKYDDSSSENEPSYAPTSAHDEAAGSPGPSSTAPTAEQAVDTVTCLWDDCGIVFTHLPTLIEHIHTSEPILSLSHRPSTTCPPSPYWRSQVQLYLRMVHVQPPWARSDLPFRTYLAHPFAHRRKAIYMFPTRQVDSSWGVCLV